MISFQGYRQPCLILYPANLSRLIIFSRPGSIVFASAMACMTLVLPRLQLKPWYHNTWPDGRNVRAITSSVVISIAIILPERTDFQANPLCRPLNTGKFE